MLCFVNGFASFSKYAWSRMKQKLKLGKHKLRIFKGRGAFLKVGHNTYTYTHTYIYTYTYTYTQ